MIYEREVRFSMKELNNHKNFPSILIIRKKKLSTTTYNNMQGWTNALKNFMRVQTVKSNDLINVRTKE